MTHTEIIDELGAISRGITAGSPTPIPDPTRRLVDAVMAIEDLRGRLINERPVELPADVWNDYPWQPPEAGSWRDKPSLLNPPLDHSPGRPGAD